MRHLMLTAQLHASAALCRPFVSCASVMHMLAYLTTVRNVTQNSGSTCTIS